ncbi:MAG: hypothetical protein AAGI66_00905 [Cyanobacteria bacterium P01_H01_bin.74]
MRQIASAVASNKTVAPHFGLNFKKSGNLVRLTNHLSLPSPFAVTGANQLHLIYPGIIGWRLTAANNRRRDSESKSWNEVREVLIRDPIGMLFWVFTTPIVQRLTIARQPKAIKQSLLDLNKAPEKGWLAKLNYAINPLAKYGLPSNQQVEDHKTQTLMQLKEAGVKPESKAYQTTEKFLDKLIEKRNTASMASLILSVAVLGFGINMVNFALTRRNVEARKRAFARSFQESDSSLSDGKTQNLTPFQANGFRNYSVVNASLPFRAAQSPASVSYVLSPSYYSQRQPSPFVLLQ